MSNLGTIYSLNFQTGEKELYPVVYENKTKYYCKVHGSDDLKTFYKEDSYYHGVYTYEDYLKKKDIFLREKWSNVRVYIKPNEKSWFEELKDATIKSRIDDLQRTIETKKVEVFRLKTKMENIPEQIHVLEEEISKCEEKIEELSELPHIL